MSLLEICPSSNAQGDIIALGELLVDFVPMEPEMKLCDSGAVIKTASGSSGIFACAVANFAGRSSFLGKIGCDALSQMVNRVVEKYGVDLKNACVSSEGQIGLAFLEYTDEGRNYQYYRKNSVGSTYKKEDLNEAFLAKGFALHFPGMLLELSEEMREACMRAVDVARENGVLVSFDPNIRKEICASAQAMERLRWVISRSDIIAPTLEESQMITGKQDVSDILQTLHSMGPRVVALTCDKDGAILSAGGQAVWARGIDAQAIDPTGAGDTFAAALVYAVQQNFSLTQAALFCNCAGTLTTTKRGAVGMALPTLQEVYSLMEKSPCCIEDLTKATI